VLALRDAKGEFTTNPGPDTVVSGGDVLIVIGTGNQIEDLISLVAQTDGAA
jgi:K+/H+ antiporter YhaU regulatory subunit KhtT